MRTILVTHEPNIVGDLLKVLVPCPPARALPNQPTVTPDGRKKQGHLEFFICNADEMEDPDGVPTQGCFNKHPLTRAPGDDDNSPIDPAYPGRYYGTEVVLHSMFILFFLHDVAIRIHVYLVSI